MSYYHFQMSKCLHYFYITHKGTKGYFIIIKILFFLFFISRFFNVDSEMTPKRILLDFTMPSLETKIRLIFDTCFLPPILRNCVNRPEKVQIFSQFKIRLFRAGNRYFIECTDRTGLTL